MNDEADDTMHGFEHIEALLRESHVDDATLLEPPSDIWAAIEASIVADPPAEASSAADFAPQAQPDPADGVADATVTRLADRRRPSTWIGAVAAATVLVVAGAIAVTAVRSNSPAAPVVATAELTWDASAFDPIGSEAAATAELVGDESGYTIDIDQARLPDPVADGEELELWLIQPDAENNPAALVSLGTIDTASTTTFNVPDGFDPGEYFIVDISIEPNDGNPAHSGRSILRGPLVQA